MARVTPRTSSTGSPTLDEVARVAGVSRATASRAINGGQKVSARAQSAVDLAVRELGYVPHPAARSLATRRTDSIAVLVPEPDDRVFSDPFFAGTLRGVNRVLSERDIQLVLLLARPGADTERTLRYLTNRHVDGAIVTSHHRDDRLAEHLADIGLPCVFGGRPWTGGDRISYVDVDNVAGEREATEVLLARGCTRIGTVAGPADMTAAVDRLAGWTQAMTAAGLPVDAVEHGDFTEASGETACRALLERHPDLDGLVVASDLMAAGAMRVLAALGPPGARRRRRDRLRRPRRRRAHHAAAHHGPPAGRGDGRARRPAAARPGRRRRRRAGARRRPAGARAPRQRLRLRRARR